MSLFLWNETDCMFFCGGLCSLSRYEAHAKLVNFLVPVPTATWHEEMTTELFNNLFGQKATHSSQNGAADNDEVDDVVASEDERIF